MIMFNLPHRSRKKKKIPTKEREIKNEKIALNLVEPHTNPFFALFLVYHTKTI